MAFGGKVCYTASSTFPPEESMGSRRAAPAFLSGATFVAVLSLLVPSHAWADRHKAALAGGPIRGSRSELWGIGTSFEIVTPKLSGRSLPGTPPRHSRTLALAIEASQLAGVHEDREFSQMTALAGPRVAWSSAKVLEKLQPFAHVLGGYVRERAESTHTSFAWTVGGGVDWVVDPGWALRLQLGLYRIEGDRSDSYGQGSLALVFRIGDLH
jgi:hypothetical protein